MRYEWRQDSNCTTVQQYLTLKIILHPYGGAGNLVRVYGAYEKMLGIKSTTSMSLSEIRNFNQHYKRKQGTLNQVVTALREHPYILRRIIQLPTINKFYRIAKATVPDSLWNRLENVFRANNGNKQHRLHEKPILRLTRKEVDFFLTRARVRIDKAKRLLGYQPDFNLEKGMKLTEEWLRFANLI